MPKVKRGKKRVPENVRLFNQRIDACISAVNSFRSLMTYGASPADAERVFTLWMERARALGPNRRNCAAHARDYWAQNILYRLAPDEECILRHYGIEGFYNDGIQPVPIIRLPEPAKRRPRIKRKKVLKTSRK